MIALAGRMLSFVHDSMSSQMHNYGVLVTLTVWTACVLSTLVWPDPVRLDVTKDVGIVVLGWMGMVAGAHTVKAVRGVESSTRAAQEADPR